MPDKRAFEEPGTTGSSQSIDATTGLLAPVHRALNLYDAEQALPHESNAKSSLVRLDDGMYDALLFEADCSHMTRCSACCSDAGSTASKPHATCFWIRAISSSISPICRGLCYPCPLPPWGKAVRMSLRTCRDLCGSTTHSAARLVHGAADHICREHARFHGVPRHSGYLLCTRRLSWYAAVISRISNAHQTHYAWIGDALFDSISSFVDAAKDGLGRRAARVQPTPQSVLDIIHVLDAIRQLPPTVVRSAFQQALMMSVGTFINMPNFVHKFVVGFVQRQTGLCDDHSSKRAEALIDRNVGDSLPEGYKEDEGAQATHVG
jgi:hypothetical protein